MAELTPEEKERIYLEEKARLEAQELVKKEQAAKERAHFDEQERVREELKAQKRRKNLIVWLGIIGLLMLVGIFGEKKSGMQSDSPDRSPQKEAVVSPSCDVKKATTVIREAQNQGILYKIESAGLIHPDIYIGDVWYGLSIDDKQNFDKWIQCFITNGDPKPTRATYRDSRTGREVAKTGRLGFEVK